MSHTLATKSHSFFEIIVSRLLTLCQFVSNNPLAGICARRDIVLLLFRATTTNIVDLITRNNMRNHRIHLALHPKQLHLKLHFIPILGPHDRFKMMLCLELEGMLSFLLLHHSPLAWHGHHEPPPDGG